MLEKVWSLALFGDCVPAEAPQEGCTWRWEGEKQVQSSDCTHPASPQETSARSDKGRGRQHTSLPPLSPSMSKEKMGRQKVKIMSKLISVQHITIAGEYT